MKKLILIPILFLFGLFFANAQEIYQEPYNDVFTTESELGKTLSEIRTELGIRSCYIDEYWESKSCDYLYYMYMILPSTATSFQDELKKDAKEVTDASTVELVIKDFIPPKGVLYYVVTFISVDHAVCNLETCTAEQWDHTAEIPEAYINAHSIRSVCPEGQMLNFDMDAGEYKCYLSKRICLDTMNTGLCTNVYTLWAMDCNEDGVVSDLETKTGACLCADRPLDVNQDGIYEYPTGDGICDLVRDLECVDECSLYEMDVDGNLVCTVLGSDGLCDEWNQASFFSCIDDVLSQNSKICDDIDAVCSTNYNPVCVAVTEGTRIGGETYPNFCFSQAKGYDECTIDVPSTTCYVMDACTPPVIQCYVVEDCPDLDVCLGGSTAGISKMCLDYRCSYTGACGSLECQSDADCAGLAENVCVGMASTCSGAPNGICTLDGSCLQPPAQKLSIWDLILQLFANFFAWVKGLFA